MVSSLTLVESQTQSSLLLPQASPLSPPSSSRSTSPRREILDSHDACHYVWLVWRILGMNPLNNYPRLYRCYSIFININFCLISPLHYILLLFFISDFTLIVRNLTISLSSVSSAAKQMIIFYYSQTKLQELRVHLERLDRRAELNAGERKLIEQAVYFCHRLFFAYYTVYNCALWAYATMGYMQHTMPFDSWLPFDWTKSQRAYLCAFLYEVTNNYFQLIQNLTNDTYSVTYLVVLIAHLRALNIRIARIGTDEMKSTYENYIELVKCVKDHFECMRYLGCIYPVISGTMCAQFLVTAFVLCITGLGYVNSNRSFGQLLVAVIYLSCILIEVLPCCWYVNELIDVSDYLTTALYECKWYEQDQRFRRVLIIFMQRSQQKTMILAGNFAPVTLQTFVSILRFAFSMFTMLRENKA